MAAERRQQISDLYHAVRERSPEERSAYLQEACAGDDALCAEVEPLLRYGAASRISRTPATGTTLGGPRGLFPTGLRHGWQFRPYDVTRDGQRFLVPTMRPGDDFRVVLNWRTLLPR